MTEIVVSGARQILPVNDVSVYVVTYSKGVATDTIDCSFTDGISTTANGAFLPIKNVRFVSAVDDTAGALDVTTYSGSVITFVGTGALTGAGKLLVVGNC